MTLEHNSSQLLQDLLGSLRDGNLTDEQIVQLDIMLADDAEARETYLDYVQLCADLRSHYGVASPASLSIDSEKTQAVPLPAGHSFIFIAPIFRRWGLLTGSLIASLLIIALILNHWSSTSSNNLVVVPDLPVDDISPSLNKLHEKKGVAVLTKTTNVVWKDGQSPVVSDSLFPGRLKLMSGLVQIEFYQGAIVILEGPVDFELIDSQRAFLHQGKLRSFVPMPSRGFVIDTPQRQLIDHGTEFGLVVDDQGVTKVHVFDGKVEMKGKKSDFLTEGESKQYSKEGESKSIPFDGKSFSGPAELETGFDRELLRRKKVWQKQAQALSEDPSALVYYLFEKQGDWGRSLKDISSKPYNGAIVGCQWAEGRWKQKNALEFKRTTDRVRISVPGEYQSLTFMAWIRIEGYGQWLNAIMLTDGFEDREVHWQLSDNGELILGINNHGVADNYFSPKTLSPQDLGRWVHLVTVYDHHKKQVTHYFDGQKICQLPVKLSGKLRIGEANIGNWSSRQQSSQYKRPLNGLVDEFAIFSRPFEAKEIKQIYLTGKPN